VKSARYERSQRRDVVIEKRQQKHMRKLMKRPDQSWKEIRFDDTYRRELENLRELQTRGRMAS
jgi:hypothetical protein